MTFEQIQAMQNMGFTKEDIMEVIRSSSGETAPAPTPEPKPEEKPEEKTTPPTADPTADSIINTLPGPQPAPKAEDDSKEENKDHELLTSLIKQVETLTGAIQQSNIVNAQMGDVKTNQQIVDDILADIVNPTYKHK